MPNNYFQFKQFIIYQDKCSMKVCTDACIFGAWMASSVMSDQSKIISCLDIGTGTGLLSLMLAQKTNVTIDAIEIEINSFEQAKENFRNSLWNERLQIINADAKEFIASKRYDLIISNPPFFENDLLSGSQNNNLAKHDAGLSLRELLEVIKNNIAVTGRFAILLPYHRAAWFEQLVSENGFYPGAKLLVRQTPAHDYFRAMFLFGKEIREPKSLELTIKNKEGNYSEEFTALLKDYYLHL